VSVVNHHFFFNRKNSTFILSNYFAKVEKTMRKTSNFFILIMFLTISCQKESSINNYPADISFNVSNQLFEGRRIDCIASDNNGNIIIGSDKEVYYTSNKSFKTYKLDFPVLDVAIAPDETVWIGTNGGGLGHLTDKGFTWYTVANAGLPRDYVKNVEIAPDGKVWFTSCAFKIGGLGIFDGNKFEFLTPDNSPLNQNIITDIEISNDGIVYIATAGTVSATNIYRISDKKWECLGDEKGTFYWVWSFTSGPSGTLYLIEDFSLSSYYPNFNKLYQFRESKWQMIVTDDLRGGDYFAHLIVDKRNYCWISGNIDDSPILNVYNGESWIKSPAGIFPEDFITCIEVDNNNNIWVGTFSNGVFILNQ
jgi:ligand-binding sensor domain-containing protein